MISRRLVIIVAAVGIILAASIPAFGGNIEKADTSDTTPCGKVSIAVNNWVGYEADAFVVGNVAQKDSAAWSTTSTSTSRSRGRGSRAGRSTRSWRTGATPSSSTSTSRSCTWRRTPEASASPV